ncbi:MAG: SGNH/GDSL hydrolase family protein [Pseudomonadota bacterium]
MIGSGMSLCDQGARSGVVTPVIAFSSPLIVPADAAAGAFVAQAVIGGQPGPHAFTLTDDAGGRFAISTAGALTVGAAPLVAGTVSISISAMNGVDPTVIAARVADITPVAPIALGALSDFSVFAASGVRIYDASVGFQNADGGTWSLVSPIAGVAIDQSGIISIDTDAIGLIVTAITVRYQNGGGAAENGFALSIVDAPAAPPHAVDYFWDFSNQAAMTLSGDQVDGVADEISGVVAAGGSVKPVFLSDASAIGGPKGRLRFSGGAHLTLPVGVALDTQAISVFCVTRLTRDQWERQQSAYVSLNTASRDFVLIKNGSQAVNLFTKGNNAADISDTAGASVFWAVGDSSNGWVGADRDEWAKGSPFNPSSMTGGWIGKLNGTASTWDFDGDMQAVLIYDRALSPAERADVLDWLSSAYGTAAGDATTPMREYVFDGDSITEGVGAGDGSVAARVDFSYPAQTQAIVAGPPPRTHNAGNGGDSIRLEASAVKVLDRLATSRSTNDRIVFGLYGTNDLSNGRTALQVAADYEIWMANIRAAYPDVRIGLGTVLNTNRWAIPSSNETERLAFNDQVRGLAGSMSHDFFIDTQATPALADPADLSVFADGLHLTTAGYGALAAVVRAGLDAQP